MAALTACGGGLAVPVHDACNRVHTWSAAGVPAQEAAGVLRDVRSSLGEAEELRLDGALASLESAIESGDPESAAAADSFEQACTEIGWEPAEG